MTKMNDEEIRELHGIMMQWFIDKGKTPKEVISFLTATWVGQMALNGYKEEFVDKTLVHMKERWNNHAFNKHRINHAVD